MDAPRSATAGSLPVARHWRSRCGAAPACNGPPPPGDQRHGVEQLSTANEITCRELVEVITDYLEGAMPPAQRRRFEAHLAECPYCVNYLGQMRLTISALGELREESIAPDAREALLEASRDWRG